jgi:hypothetical protein
METTYRPELWRDLYVMLGTSSAALLGLLFVVTSLHLDEIIENPVYRMRARSNSIFLVVTLVEAALVLTPQPVAQLGLELTVLNVFGWSFPIRNSYRYFFVHRELSKRGGMTIFRAAIFHGDFLLGIAGGACLIGGSNWGMPLITASYVALLASISMNAWSIMLGVGQDEKTVKERPKRRAR